MIPNASYPADDALSLWEDVSPARLVSRSLNGEAIAEVVVIGGGFTGLSAALQLAKSGRKVCLIEGRTIGWGGSGRNNGQAIPVLAGCEPSDIEEKFGEAGEQLVALIRDSASTLFDLVREENIDCEAEQTGWFQPAHSPDHVKLSESRVNAWAKRGAPCELLNCHEAQRLLGSNNWYGGMLNPTGGHINPLMLARGLAQTCERAGVEIYEYSPANSVKRIDQKWIITTPNGSLKCDAVLMATNAYSNELSTSLELNVSRSIIPVASWQMSTSPLSAELRGEILPGRHAVSDTRGDLQFFRYDARNQLVAGAAMISSHAAARRLNKLVGQRLTTAFPQLGKPKFTHIWSGYVGITPDHFPHFHQLGPDYFAAIGFNGRGVALAISVGMEMAKAINGANMQNIALPFSRPQRIPFQPIVRKLSRAALGLYRWRDKQKPKY